MVERSAVDFFDCFWGFNCIFHNIRCWDAAFEEDTEKPTGFVGFHLKNKNKQQTNKPTQILKNWGIRSYDEMSGALYSIKAYGVNVSISADKSIMV